MKPILQQFFLKAKDRFNDYSQMDYSALTRAIKHEGLVKKMSDNYMSSAFAFYLLMYLDPKIHFLSLFFSEKSKDVWLERFPWLVLVKEDDLDNYMERVSSASYQIFKLCDLSADNFYQPESQLGALVDRFGKSYTYLLEECEAIQKDSRRKISKLEKSIAGRIRSAEKAYAERDKAKAEAEQLRLELRTKSDSPRQLDNDYVTLQRKVEKAERAKNSAENRLQRLTDKYNELEQNYEARGRELKDMDKKIQELNGKIRTLEDQVNELLRIPKLREFFDSKKVLVISGIPKATVHYRDVAVQIFSEFEVKNQETCNGIGIDDYDLVIGTSGLPHSHLACTHHNFLFYPGSVNRFIPFLYKLFVENGNGKKK